MSKHLENPGDKLANDHDWKSIMLNTLKYQIYIVSPEYDFIWANQAFEEEVGLPLSKLKGKKCYEVVHQANKPPEFCALHKMLKDNEFRLMETEIELNGRTLHISATPVLDDQGKLEKVIHIIKDMSEHKRNKKALLESEEKHRTFVSKATDGITIAQDEVVKFANPSFARMLGYEIEEMEGIQMTRLIPQEHLQMITERYRKRLAGEKVPATYETELLHKNGSKVPVEVSGNLIQYEGKPADLAIIRDITERKRAEEALHESEERYRSLVENASDGIIIVQDGIIKYANTRMAQLDGSSVAELVGTSFTRYVHPDELPRIAENYRRRMAGEKVPSIYETVLRRKDGASAPAELNANVITYQGRSADMVTIRDITERKKAEDALQLNLTRLAEAEKTAKIGNWEANLITDELYWSEVIFDIFGFKSESFKPNVKAFYEAVHPDDREIVLKSEQLSEQTGFHDVVHRIIRPDGEIRFVHELAKRYADDHGRLIMLRGTVQDITERKRSEKALQESEEKFRGLAEQSPNMIFINSEGRIVYANKKCVEIMGYSRENLYSENFDFMDLISSESRNLVKASLKKHALGRNVPPYEYKLLTKGGEEIVGIHTTKLINLEGKRAVLGIITDITEQVRSREQIKTQAASLEQKNAALRELLSQITVEKKALEDRMHQNLDKLVIPKIKRLKSRAEDDLKDQLGVIEKVIKDITSAFGKKISSQQRALSSREIEVCDMIRSGLKNKAIARSLRLSLETIETMRKTIRRKLKIQNKQVNLKTYLQTM